MKIITTRLFSSSLRPLLLVAFYCVSSTLANKDDAYYANGVTNPNVVDEKMYWHEARNVLEDLSQFQTLYISYHNCAWETPTGGEENGGGGGDGDDWYMGSVPTFQANVAFSLYGILKGDKDIGCRKKSFINSFHTTQGVESFTNAMAAAGLSNLFEIYDGDEGEDDGYGSFVTSTCYENEDGDGQDEGDDNMGNGDKYYSGAGSFGVGCTAGSSSSKFAIHTYGGSYCDANAILETLDDLEDFNERLEMSKCVPIYNDGDYYSGNQEDNKDEDSSSPLALLETSRVCRLYDGTGSCPDPYGKLQQYEYALAKATGAIEEGPWWTAQRVFVAAWSMIAVGIFLALVGITVIASDCLNFDFKRTRPKKRTTTDDELAASKNLERSRTDGTLESHLSNAISLASSISREVSRSLGFSKSSKASKASKESKKSHKSNKSKHSKKSQRSSKSTRSNKSNRSNQPELYEDEYVDKHIIMNRNGTNQSKQSYTSNVSNLSDGHHEDYDYDQTEDTTELGPNTTTDDHSVASASVQAVNDLVQYFQNKRDEFFKEGEVDHDEASSVEMRIPDTLPYSSPAVRAPDETEVASGWTQQEETTSKRKWRKRRWFRKLMGDN